jgi:hypothetical protein
MAPIHGVLTLTRSYGSPRATRRISTQRVLYTDGSTPG